MKEEEVDFSERYLGHKEFSALNSLIDDWNTITASRTAFWSAVFALLKLGCVH